MPALRRLLVATLAVALLAGCDDGTASTPTTTVGSAAPSTTAAPPTTLSAKAELLAAYDRSWEVYADALRRLDPGRQHQSALAERFHCPGFLHDHSFLP